MTQGLHGLVSITVTSNVAEGRNFLTIEKKESSVLEKKGKGLSTGPEHLALSGRRFSVKKLVGAKDRDFDEQKIESLLRKDLPLHDGRHLHARIVGLGLEQRIFVANLLLRMYAKCGDLDGSSALFCKLHERDLISWNTILTLCSQAEHFPATFSILDQLEANDVKPDAVSYLIILKACSRWVTLAEGERTHGFVIESGLDSNLWLTTALVDMYGSCNLLHRATITFNKTVARDVAAWNALLGAHIRTGSFEEVLTLFTQMHTEGMKPNIVTFVHALSACIDYQNLETGNLIYTSIVEGSLDSDVILNNALVTMYGKCGDLWNACKIFDIMDEKSVVSWTAIITEYSRHGFHNEAMDYFYRMQSEGIHPSEATFVSAVCACSGFEALFDCQQIHIDITQRGYESNVLVGTALIDMYGKCGRLLDASAAFENISRPNIVSQNALITAYVQQGHGDRALELYKQYVDQGSKPDKVTFLGAIKACILMKSLPESKEIHERIIKQGLESDVAIGNALIDMYGKCAALELAHATFDDMEEHNVISWTTLISSYAQAGHGETALALYRNMQHDGIRPNRATFSILLSACNHAGLVDAGRFYFGSMTNDYGIEPEYDHYGIMVDLYGRVGLLKEAEDFIDKMPMKADECIWTSFLDACHMHGDLKREKRALDNVAHWKVSRMGVTRKSG